MDEGLRRLERESRSDPSDIEAARRLDHALARAGDGKELRRRYRAKFLCPLRFEELTPTADPLRRACDRCHRSVRFVRTEAELTERVAEGACVAFQRRDLGRVLDLTIADPRLHSAADPWRSCLVATDLPFVDLDRVEVHDAVLRVVPREVAEHFEVFPVAAGPDVVCVAMADPSADALLHDLQRELELEVRPVLADRDAVKRAIARHHVQTGMLLGTWFAEMTTIDRGRAVVRTRDLRRVRDDDED